VADNTLKITSFYVGDPRLDSDILREFSHSLHAYSDITEPKNLAKVASFHTRKIQILHHVPALDVP
jgi:hypothetical protein